MHRTLSIVIISSIFLLILPPPLPVSSAAAKYRSSIRSKPTDPDRNKPRNILVEVVNATSIYLQWDPPKESVLEQCPVLRYLIRLKTEGARKSRTWKINGSRQSVTLHDLVIGTTYYVRLLAVVCDAKGKPSRWLRVRTTTDGNSSTPPSLSSSSDAKNDAREKQTPSKPTYVRTRTFPDSVIVSWLPPEDETVVRGYMVGYGEGVPDVNWQYVDATRTNVTIRNLKPATQYIVSLRAFNNFGKGPVVYDLIYTREHSATTVGPASTPIDFKAKILSPTTVWLQWSDPSLGRVQQLTDNRYYNVHYQPMSSSSTGKTLSVIVKAFHVVLYDLLPGTRYEFKVRMVKDAQASPFSEPIANKTFETAPSSPPRGLTVQSTNISGSVIISWRPPRLPNGDITGYLVLFSHDPDLTVDKWQVQAVPGHDLSTTISGLTSNKTYHFKVQGRNSNGHSPLSSTTAYYTKPQLYHDTVLQSPSSSSSSSSSSTFHSSPPPALSAIASDNTTNTTSSQPEHSASRGRTNEGDEASPPPPEDENEDDDEDEDEEEVDDEDYSYDGGATAAAEKNGVQVAALVAEQPSTSTSTSKAKREPVNSKQPPPSQPPHAPGPQHLSDLPGPPSSIHFRNLIQYHVSAYITWPDTLSKCSGAWSSGSSSVTPVTGYLFRYAEHGVPAGSGGQASQRYVTRNLTNNFVLLEDLVPESTYRYQVKYLFRGGVQSSWSGESTVDTHYKTRAKL